MKRRDFLHPGNLARSAAQLLGRTEPDLPPQRQDVVLVRFGRRAMATNFEVIVPFGTDRAAAAAGQGLDLIDALEDQLTVYRDHSEVSRLNRTAADAPVVVAKELFDLFVLARQLHQETEGAFDISVGALIKAWGFYRRQGRVPSPEECQAALERVGMQHVTLNAADQSVFFDCPGLEINLGSIGKGYALDRLTQLLWRDWHIGSALVHGGHSSIFALGNEEGWPVALSDPLQPSRQLGLFRLCNRALGTSSATYQHLVHEGRRLGHILDPRTGWPASGLLSATVTAPTAAVADALATAFFILGTEPARAYCESHPEIGAVLVREKPRGKPVILGQALQEYDHQR